MNVGFYLQYNGEPMYYVYAGIMLESIRRTMRVDVVQFTDLDSKALKGVNDVMRLPNAPLSEFRSAHYASVFGDWLFIDTDVVIKEDVRHIFDTPFDIAVTDRNWPHQPVPKAFAEAMPYNAGVIFSRSQKFWMEIHTQMVNEPPKSDWYGDQKAICDLAKSGRYNVHVLDGYTYNYPPESAIDPARRAKIVHSKGNRKAWMLNHSYLEQQCV